MISGISPDLPHTAALPNAREWPLRLVRPLAALVLRVWWRVQVRGQAYVPSSGPVILAANHIGLLDGPAVVALNRRLTFAMAKHELFSGWGGRLLMSIGQISINRRELDPGAIKRAIQVLRAGKVLCVFPEGRRGSGEMAGIKGGTAYLAMVTGAPVVPVALLGTREPGQTNSGFPRRGGPIRVVFGEPFAIPRTPWPRTQADVAHWTQTLRVRLAEHVAYAQAATGLPLPGEPKPKSAPLAGGRR